MTYGSSGGDRLNKNERREAAREKAKTLRDQQRKKEKRSRLILQGSLILVVVAFAAGISLILMNSVRPPAPGPRNMLSDGILISEGFTAKSTPALQPGNDPVPNERDEEADVISIQIFVDYLCPVCRAFEEANQEQIAAWIESDGATIEIFPHAILDRYSQGTKYSTRAANAAACVADFSPNQFYAFNSILFENQPDEGSSGLTDNELVDLTEQVEVEKASAVAACITDQTFAGWVADARDRNQLGPIPNSNVTSVTGTPTVIVNGLQYTGALNDSSAFAAFVVQAANASFNESSSATPTPTPVPAP